MIDDLNAAFEKFAEEYLGFERIKNPLFNRPDLCAFVLLQKLVPGSGHMINGAEEDVIYLSVDIEKLAQVASDEDIIYLRRCGVGYNNKYNCLVMFV